MLTIEGMYVKESIVWFRPLQMLKHPGTEEERKERDREHKLLEAAIRQLGLPIEISEDLEDLRLSVSKAEPLLVLLELLELDAPAEWPGWAVISDIREEGIPFPVMVIGGDASGSGAAAALAAGGNEYMSRPIHTGEFSARVLNLIELTGRRRGLKSLLRMDGLVLDPARRQASRDGHELKLTPKEFDLLYYLADHRENICPRDEILKHVWGYHFHADTNVVDVYIRHIRLKVDKGYRQKLIHTVRGAGYVMKALEDSATS
ncbi:winged helix-turn-helix domain-containing protein [Paenibacillus donghaensis]|uniref:OmpR/PhoB-type domain-containing protein n=1 Tax=Paenibacillus donghaensis TaxID=414771 RepID=A0A2Z2K951_9BACL|nr:winged helix-turn-helix domain-containing protein [Paenibacillus donghaensis]ASA21887.1 hypothetical protein B9T62_14545 [Paenibacillus donghaensis]